VKERLNKDIDRFIDNVNVLLEEFLAAKTMYDIGRDTIDSISDDAAISPLVGVDLHLEPIPIVSIKRYKDKYPHFILEVYHGKLVQLWNDLLEDIFYILVKEHIIGGRKFSELKWQKVGINFDSSEDFLSQLKENLIKDFSFWEYSERQRIINKALNPNNERQAELDNVKRNILIRNSIQHKDNIVDDYILGKLGCNEIQLYDDDGILRSYKNGDKILLSIPEIHNFIRSLLFVVQKWRK